MMMMGRLADLNDFKKVNEIYAKCKCSCHFLYGEIDQEYWSTWPRSYGIHNQQYFTHHKVKDGSYVSKMKLPNSDKKLKERKQNKKNLKMI